jgi:hypothetical protein
MPTLKTIIMTGIKEYVKGIKGVLGTQLGKIPKMKEWPTKVNQVDF